MNPRFSITLSVLGIFITSFASTIFFLKTKSLGYSSSDSLWTTVALSGVYLVYFIACLIYFVLRKE